MRRFYCLLAGIYMSTVVFVYADDPKNEEVVLLKQAHEGTLVKPATDDPQIYSIEKTETVAPAEADSDSNAKQRLENCRRMLRHSLAGFPQCVSPRARLTYDTKYQAYYVGGGTPKARGLFCSGGDKHCPNEGTFGVDYAPWYSHVNLRWSHGSLYQGGTGLYDPDHKNWPFDLRRGRHTLESAE